MGIACLLVYMRCAQFSIECWGFWLARLPTPSQRNVRNFGEVLQTVVASKFTDARASHFYHHVTTTELCYPQPFLPVLCLRQGKQTLNTFPFVISLHILTRANIVYLSTSQHYRLRPTQHQHLDQSNSQTRPLHLKEYCPSTRLHHSNLSAICVVTPSTPRIDEWNHTPINTIALSRPQLCCIPS